MKEIDQEKHLLVDNGFRLPSAYDNRPLKFDEFEENINQILFVTATPGPYEIEHSYNYSRTNNKTYRIIRSYS